jgi:hypothetical protein
MKVKYILIVQLLFLVFCANSEAETICPGQVDHVSLEQGHALPYPIILIPDVGSEGETAQQEWNFIYSERPDQGNLITAHCYYDSLEKKQRKVAIPRSATRCVFLNNQLDCM